MILQNLRDHNTMANTIFLRMDYVLSNEVEKNDTSFPIIANQIHVCLLIQWQTQALSSIEDLYSPVQLSSSSIHTAPTAK